MISASRGSRRFSHPLHNESDTTRRVVISKPLSGPGIYTYAAKSVPHFKNKRTRRSLNFFWWLHDFCWLPLQIIVVKYLCSTRANLKIKRARKADVLQYNIRMDTIRQKE